MINLDRQNETNNEIIRIMNMKKSYSRNSLWTFETWSWGWYSLLLYNFQIQFQPDMLQKNYNLFVDKCLKHDVYKKYKTTSRKSKLKKDNY